MANPINKSDYPRVGGMFGEPYDFLIILTGHLGFLGFVAWWAMTYPV